MKLQIVFLLLLLTCMHPSMAQGKTTQGSYGNCCLGYVRKIRSSTRRNIQGYRMQETDGDCNIRAVVLLIKKKPTEEKPGTICANPDHRWVQDVMIAVDGRSQIIN